MLVIQAAAIAARQQRLADKIASGKQECAKCHEIKTFDCFIPASNRASGVQAYCRSCHAATMRHWYQARAAARAEIIAADPERRATAVAIRWRLGCSPAQARSGSPG